LAPKATVPGRDERRDRASYRRRETTSQPATGRLS
jgi:hypothetical protein